MLSLKLDAVIESETVAFICIDDVAIERFDVSWSMLPERFLLLLLVAL